MLFNLAQREMKAATQPGQFRVSLAIFTAIFCFAMLTGCGGDPNLGDVSGTITLDGEPLANAFVTFTPTSATGNATSTFGKTKTDGSYRMYIDDRKVGVYIGENLVRIRTGDVLSDGSGATKEVVPTKYNTESELRADVKSGNSTMDFELETAGGKVKQLMGRQLRD